MLDEEIPTINHPALDGPIERERIVAAVGAAREAFWASLAGALPEIPSGDFDPAASVEFEHWTNGAALHWIRGNLPGTDYTADGYLIWYGTGEPLTPADALGLGEDPAECMPREMVERLGFATTDEMYDAWKR